MSREMTTDEVRERFLNHVRGLVKYWDEESRAGTQSERLSGLAFSMLVLLDGGAGMIPSFIVAPCPHKDDKQYRQDNGQNWWPENNDDEVKADIGGCLHELFYKKK